MINLQPFVWHGQATYLAKPLSSQGYISSILSVAPGSKHDQIAFVDPALASAGVLVTFFFEVQDSVVLYSLLPVSSTIVFVANVACLVGSTVFYIIFKFHQYWKDFRIH